MASKGKAITVLVMITIVVFVLVYLGITFTSDLGKTKTQVTSEDATKRLDKLYKNITVRTEELIKGQIDLDPAAAGDSLPDISKFPISVANTTDHFVEIFSSTEKSGTGNDGWLNEVATDFNNVNIVLDGKAVSVKIRNIPSGTAADYIRSGKYVPDAFTPSNELWGEMVKANGIETLLVSKRLVGNVAGIVSTKTKYDELVDKYGSLNVKTITDAIADNELAMGYTDPFASSTGLNFLVTALESFDSSDLLGKRLFKGLKDSRPMYPLLRPQHCKCVMQPSLECSTPLCWSIKPL